MANIYLNNRNAMVLVLIVSVVGIMYEYFVNRSTTTMIISCLSDLGRVV